LFNKYIFVYLLSKAMTIIQLVSLRNIWCFDNYSSNFIWNI